MTYLWDKIGGSLSPYGRKQTAIGFLVLAEKLERILTMA